MVVRLKFLLFPALALSGMACSTSRPISSEPPKNNNTYKVEYLFEHDGCRVYRFRDEFQWVYFTNCRGEAIGMTDSTVVRNTTNVKPGGN